ncbi:MAG: NUDIX domain-containing protein [Candidatus Moranbacteria bacterium]|nr:NUDIX domain-containing protein [Candidatus Moranbacteria bacterium]
MKIITFEKSVGAVVFRRKEAGGKEFLLLHYPSGHWDFPKGHMESGETEEMTLRREVEEETGLKDLRLLPGHRDSMWYFYRAKGKERQEREKDGRGINVFKRVVYYAAETEGKEIGLSHEHIGSVWLDYEAALARLTFPSGKKILQKTHNFLNQTR